MATATGSSAQDTGGGHHTRASTAEREEQVSGNSTRRHVRARV